MTQPRSTVLRLAARVALTAALLAGCSSGPNTPAASNADVGESFEPSLAPGIPNDTPPTASSHPVPSRAVPQVQLGYERTFGPTYPSEAPNRERLVPIDRAILSADRLTLTIDFVGGIPYNPARPDPCTTDYAPWLAPRGDELDVAVSHVAHPAPARSGPMVFCTLEGHFWQFHLLLAAPFDGTTVNDLAGGTLLVGPPASTARLGSIPAGWTLQASFQIEPGPPPMWAEIYGPAPGPPGSEEGPGWLALYQAFGIVGEWSETRAVKSQDRGGTATAVTFRGRPAVVWVDPGIGELLFAWEAGGRSYGLVGNSADMTVDDLVRYAESVTIPDEAP
jgi:hypothetical protein